MINVTYVLGIFLIKYVINRNRISRKMGCLRQPETQVLVTQWTTIIISPCT